MGLSVHSELHHTMLCFFALLPTSASVVLRSIMLPTSSATKMPLVYVVLLGQLHTASATCTDLLGNVYAYQVRRG